MIFNKQIIFLLLACAAIIGAGFWFVFWHRARLPIGMVNISSAVQSAQLVLKIGNNNIETEVADTVWKKIKGLGGRKNLDESKGMLFPYGKPGFYGFWMKNMKFPIDLIWIGADKKVADITRNIPPESFPKTFEPKKPAQYVLEVPAGFAEKNKIKTGDKVNF